MTGRLKSLLEGTVKVCKLSPRRSVSAQLDHIHVHIGARMPLFSANKGYIGGSSVVFIVLSADSVLSRRRESSHNRDAAAR